ncbi:MAG TPA: MDR family MFS transporter [Arenibacter sp.]|nr:MDR family MFS transporter [Arenibacter sp.]
MEKTSEQKRGWILAALMLTMMLAAMDITIVSTAIPQIVSDLGGFNKFTWVFSIYLLAQTVTIPIYGKLSDMYGRKWILIFGIIIFLIGSATSAMAWNIGSLIAFRGIQGLGAGSIMATVNTIAGDIYTVKERAKIQGYLSSIWGISAILGPALGGALAEFVNWRWIFLINLPVGALSIFFLLAFFKEKVVPRKPVIDYRGAILILCTLALLLVYLLEGGQSWPWLSWPSYTLLILVIIMFLWTYRVESRSPHAIMPAWLWKNRTLAFTNFAMMGMGIVMMGPETFLPTFTQASLGLGIIASGFVLASMSIGWPIASALSGRLYLRIGFRETSMIGAVLVFMACIWFLLIPKPQPIYLIVMNQVMMGAGFGLLSTPSLVGTQSMVPWQHRGTVTSDNVFSRNLGQSLGATLVGAVFNNSLQYQMGNAPADLPSATQNVMEILNDPQISIGAKTYLREAINLAMGHVYWGLAFFTIVIFLCLYRVPHRDPNKETRIELEK